jgi:hypothetical protein
LAQVPPQLVVLPTQASMMTGPTLDQLQRLLAPTAATLPMLLILVSNLIHHFKGRTTQQARINLRLAIRVNTTLDAMLFLSEALARPVMVHTRRRMPMVTTVAPSLVPRWTISVSTPLLAPTRLTPPQWLDTKTTPAVTLLSDLVRRWALELLVVQPMLEQDMATLNRHQLLQRSH